MKGIGSDQDTPSMEIEEQNREGDSSSPPVPLPQGPSGPFPGDRRVVYGPLNHGPPLSPKKHAKFGRAHIP